MAAPSALQHLLEKFLFNPLMRSALLLGIAPKAFALVETTGHKSGQRRQTPVGNGLDGNVFWLISEHGRRGAYVKNLIANPNVRVKIGRRWYSGTASLVDNDDSSARRREIDAGNGLFGKLDGVIFRASASTPSTIRIDLAP
jgi:deazaflavin-dependent oxidoreductase (nitroreductase family)